jgi:hypothetical protein
LALMAAMQMSMGLCRHSSLKSTSCEEPREREWIK